jgi:hypothetical protein
MQGTWFTLLFRSLIIEDVTDRAEQMDRLNAELAEITQTKNDG